MLAIVVGFLLDFWLGDPHEWPHIVRCMGAWIAFWEKRLLRFRRFGGFLLGIFVLGATGLLAGGVLHAAYRVSPWLGIAIDAFLCYQCLAAKSLRDESMKVHTALESGDIPAARQNLSMIVGRDTQNLSEEDIARAAVETVAENASDGIIAPLFYLLLGGGFAGCLYKAVNTMDSMVGYKNEKYREFGFFAAKLDDIANFLPARVAAMLMIAASKIGGYDGKNAWRMYKRDKRKHASPNAAHTEAVAAGALHIRLAGDAWYFGKLHKKPSIGDDDRPIEAEDIRRVNRIAQIAAVLMLFFVLLLRGVIYFAWR